MKHGTKMFKVIQERRNEQSNFSPTEHNDNWWEQLSLQMRSNQIDSNQIDSNPPAKYTAPRLSVDEPVWGMMHPDYTSQNRRILWSSQEMEYIQDWLVDNSHRTKNRATELLKHIRLDTNSHHIFHVNHIVDSTRLRHGIRKVEEAEKAEETIYYTEM